LLFVKQKVIIINFIIIITIINCVAQKKKERTEIYKVMEMKRAKFKFLKYKKTQTLSEVCG